MKRTKKLTCILLVFLLFIAIFSSYSKVEASSSDLYLQQLDFDIQVKENGNMIVTESWNIDIGNTNTLYKTFKVDKTKYSGITNTSVIQIIDNTSENLIKTDIWEDQLPKGSFFSGENPDGEFEIAWGVGLDNEYEERTYQITYEVEGAINKGSDYAELYWQFVGENFSIDAGIISGMITLPKEASEDEIKVWGHTEDLNGEINVVGSNKIEFELQDFKAGKYVEIRTLFPTQMITSSLRTQNTEILPEVLSQESKWAEEANKRRKNKEMQNNLITIAGIFVCFIITYFLIKLIIKNVRKIKAIQKIKPTENVIYYREIPRENSTPAEALAIYLEKLGDFKSKQIGKIFSAMLLNFTLKKIIEIKVKENEKGKDVVIIQLVEKDVKKIGKMEERMIYAFIREACKEKEEISMKELENYIKLNSSKVIKIKEYIDSETEKSLYNKELANKKMKEEKDETSGKITSLATIMIFALLISFPYMMELPYLLIGAIPLIIAVSINAIMIAIYLLKVNVLTQAGVDEQAKWKGLKKYMEEFSMLDKREVPELVLWEEFLVYATVFGIADKVLKQLKVVYPDWENDINTLNYSSIYLMINSNFDTSFSNSTSSAMSKTYSSASGGGGGFSGGGGGGRRPEVVEVVDKISLSTRL